MEERIKFVGANGYVERPKTLFPVTEIERAVIRVALETAYMPIKVAEEVVDRVKKMASLTKQR